MNTAVPTHQAPQKTSGLAITSLVMGILSCSIIPLILTIPAIILGIIGIKKIGNAPNELSGRGLAIAGIITGGVGILFGLITLAVLASIAMPVMSGVRSAGVDAKNATNAKQVLLGCRTYAIDKEGAFPESLEALYPDYINTKEVFQYEIDGVKKDFHYVKGLFDSSLSKTPVLYTDPDEDGDRVVGFVDGSVRTVSDTEFKGLSKPAAN